MLNNYKEAINIYDDILYANITEKQELNANYGDIKDVMILCTTADDNEECKLLLENLLKACKLMPTDAHIFYAIDNPFTALNNFKPKIAISFNLPFSVENFTLPITPYQIYNYNKIKILQADALSILLADKTKKAQLWNTLKTLFNLNG